MVIFDRKDAKVKKAAEELALEDFQQKYKGITTEVVLKSVWKDYNRQVHVKKAIVANTTESTDYPVPQEQEVVEPVRQAKKTAPKVVKKETASTTTAPTDKTRAQRLRELIALGKDKTQSKEILIAEGYEMGVSYHSEWNRLKK